LPGFFMPKKKKFSKLFLSLQFIRKSRKDYLPLGSFSSCLGGHWSRGRSRES